MLNRRQLMQAALSTSTLSWAQAQTPFPSRPLRIIVPFGAGGVADLTARAVGPALAAQLGQAVVIDNRPGAGGIVAGELVAKAEPDGHTLLLMSNGTAVSAGLFKTMPFNPAPTLRRYRFWACSTWPSWCLKRHPTKAWPNGWHLAVPTPAS